MLSPRGRENNSCLKELSNQVASRINLRHQTVLVTVEERNNGERMFVRVSHA